MIKKYRTFIDEIRECEVIRETAKQVVVLNFFGEEVKRKKSGELFSYHDTYEDAKQHLIGKAQAEVDAIKVKLKSSMEKLEEMKSL